MTNKAQTIPPKELPFAPNAPKHLDYDFLREEGLKHIQDLSGLLWTDHNTHDPGITILEVLCYALTDLAYRLQLSDADLFAPDPQKTSKTDDNFPSAYTILSCNPLTELDWRKLLIDIKGVRNAWLVPIETKKFDKDFSQKDIEKGVTYDDDKRLWLNELWQTESLVYLDEANRVLSFEPNEKDRIKYPLSIRGIYKIRLELEENLVDREPVLDEVRRRLAGHRNLCEDFGDISIVQDEPLTLCGEFELDATAQPDAVMVEIFNRIQEFFSPTIRFYTLRQMLDKGRTMEEIFEGRPMLPDSHGFVDTDELLASTLRTEIHISDIYHLILGDDLAVNPQGLKRIEGVSAVKKLSVINPKKPSTQSGQAWRVPITEGSRPTLNVAASIVGLTFLKRGIPYKVNAARVTNLFEKRLANPSKVLYTQAEEKKKGKQNLDLVAPTGEFRKELGEHYSIQNDFPIVYGIGEAGLPDSAGLKRKAQSAQLKSYLMFFDHILANYLAQVGNVRTLFSNRLINENEAFPISDDAQKPWFGKSPDAFAPLAPVAVLPKDLPNPEDLFGFAKKETVLQIGESAAPKKKPLYDIGEIVAESTVTYPNPQNRDRALRQLIADMDAGIIEPETETLKKVGELDRFHFVFNSVLGRKVSVRSIKTFEIADKTLPENALAIAAAKTVRFVATLESSYEKIDKPSEKVPYYTFRLAFRPPSYEIYLRSILEDEATFFKQKNRFFDHLLSRFSEDFTDYTLLTFATLRNNGLQIDAENDAVLSRQFALDKARFLQKYPEISRNRAKAVDFSQPLWTDKNQSGLENRVSKLIGIDERGTKTLNYFDVVSRPTRYQFVVADVHVTREKNSDGTFNVTLHHKHLMRSSLTFKSDDEAKSARQKCLELGKNKANFEPTYCPVEQVYGFRLLDSTSCPVAESVQTFGSKTLRDTQLRYAQGIFAGDGLMREFRSNTEGVYFEIADSPNSFFKAKNGATDEKTAKENLAACLQALPTRSNWQPLDDDTQQLYGFKIVDNQEVIAVYSFFAKTKPERDTRLKTVFEFFKNKKQLWQTQQYAARYRWQLVGADHKILLTSRHYFGSSEQAAAAFLEAKQAVTNPQIGQLAIRLSDKLGIQLLRFARDEEGRRIEDDYLILAQGAFDRIDERETALQTIKKLVAALDGTAEAESGNFWQSQTTKYGTARLDTEGGKFSLNLLLNQQNEAEGLFGNPVFDSKKAALAATFELVAVETTDKTGQIEGISRVVNVAENGNNYSPLEENNCCIHSFNIKNKDSVLASFEPYQLTPEAAIAKRQEIENAAKVHHLDIILKTIINQRWFEMMDETCDEQIVPILKGYEKEKNLSEIHAFYDEFKANVIAGNLKYIISEAPPFHFVFEGYAKSLVIYKTKEEAEEAALTFIELLKTKWTEPDTTNILLTENDCKDKTEFPNPNRWRLTDDEDVVARLLGSVFDENTKPNEIETARENLISQYTFAPPPHSFVFENTGNFVIDAQGGYRFALRDLEHFYWRSVGSPEVSFGSSADALKAFDEQYIEVLTSARDIQNYRIHAEIINKQSVYRIQLLGSDGKTFAESIETATDTEGVNEIMSKLQEHALAFPIVKNAADKSFSFQIYNPDNQSVLWQSVRSYEKQEKAKAAFNRFLDLLTYRDNYRVVTSEDGCQTWIELIEVLLEEVTTQKYKETEKDNTEECDWTAVETFVDDITAAGTTAFVPTVDYQNGCSYGFYLAQASHRLARFAASFHSKMKREKRRDTLFHAERCRQAMITEGSAIGQVMKTIEEKFDANNYKTVDCNKGKTDAFSYLKLSLTLPNSPFEYSEIFIDIKEIEAFISRRKEALAEARLAMPNYKSWLVLTEADGSLRLGITRADGSLIIVFDEFVAANATEMKAELEKLYVVINFNSEVIAFPDGTFGFEIREKITAKESVFINGLVEKNYDSVVVEFPIFKTIWRNIGIFPTENKAKTAVDKVHVLLKDKANYARTNAADGSPTLEIVDPSTIIAQHPRTYASAAERDAAWGNVRRHIHTEGMHLVEHLLLRPRKMDKEPTQAEFESVLTKVEKAFSAEQKRDIKLDKNQESQLLKIAANKRLLPTFLIQNPDIFEPDTEIKGFIPTDDEVDFNDYIMGADPYSFWATVVLPHWSARFRDLDFRDFFEGTLRREAPAHVALNIVWVTPCQMKMFEKVWRKWLEVAADPTHSLYICRKECLLKEFKELKSISPVAGLLDCSTGASSKLIILEKTTLR